MHNGLKLSEIWETFLNCRAIRGYFDMVIRLLAFEKVFRFLLGFLNNYLFDRLQGWQFFDFSELNLQCACLSYLICRLFLILYCWCDFRGLNYILFLLFYQWFGCHILIRNWHVKLVKILCIHFFLFLLVGHHLFCFWFIFWRF